jgi:hypothetical protein
LLEIQEIKRSDFAEYIVISKFVKETKFMFFLIHDIWIDVDLQIFVKTFKQSLVEFILMTGSWQLLGPWKRPMENIAHG